MNNPNEYGCNEYRVLVDYRQHERACLSATELDFLNEHGKNCIACGEWLAQTTKVTALATDIPQFDVPEALTQRILRSVNNERKLSSSFERISWLPLSVVAFVSILLTMPLDSESGLLSWIIGFTGVYGLKILLASANTQEQAGQL